MEYYNQYGEFKLARVTRDEMRKRREKWIAALRSGDFSQTSGTLKDEEGHCCLGVACEISLDDLPSPKGIKVYNKYIADSISGQEDSVAPDSVVYYYGLNDCEGIAKALDPWARKDFSKIKDYKGRRFNNLASANDNGMSFKAIATVLEKCIKGGEFTPFVSLDEYPEKL